jgi:hypothetical protein
MIEARRQDAIALPHPVLLLVHDRNELNPRTLIVMPPKAGIHIHRPVFMDTGVRRYDAQENLRFNP